jgi:hypothetical protein
LRTPPNKEICLESNEEDLGRVRNKVLEESNSSSKRQKVTEKCKQLKKSCEVDRRKLFRRSLDPQFLDS